ncbi:MAG TPA: hypothetical protein VI408_06870 [Gaiellaceae bacterium]
MLGGAFGYTTCPDCGTSVGLGMHDGHRCDERHRRDHAERLAVAEMELFEFELHAWLETPQGRFAAWDAERNRR